MKISDTLVNYFLTNWPVARLATLNLDGSPHQIPIVFSWHDGCFWSPIDGKPKRGGQLTRVDNAIANPAASILIDKYDDDWTQLWWIRAELEVTVIRLNEVNPEMLQQGRRAERKLVEKYPQYKSTAVLREPATILSMRPTAMMSWSAAKVEI
jgi:PPOX class probable F420-dependent enzyme